MLLQARLDAVYLVYGLSFVVAGVAILAQPRVRGQYLLADIVWLYVAYALIHAPSDFIYAGLADVGRNETAWRIAKALTLVSHLFLFEFARRLIAFSGKLRIPWWTPAIIAAAAAAVSIASADSWSTADALTGYLIRTPAGILAAAGFVLYPAADERFAQVQRAKPYFQIAAATLLVWTLLFGLVRSRADFFPANWLNSDSFRAFVGAPVEIFRTGCGIVMVWTIAMILRIFHWESINAVQRIQAEAHFRRRLQDALDIQTATNTVLHLGLEEGTLDTILGRALNEIISIPWLSVERKGAVLLADAASRVLQMRAEQGLSTEICRACARIPYGSCLCGRAVESSTVLFADHVDERHEIHYHRMTDHGHYVVPMRLHDVTIGVLSLYLKAGHVRDPKEEEFLLAIAAVLSGIVVRKRAEEALRDSRRQQRALLDNIPDRAWLKDKDGRLIAINEAYAQAFHMGAESIIGKTDADLWPPAVATRFRADDVEVMRSGKRKPLEEAVPGPDGAAVWFATVKTPIFDDRGEVAGTAGIARDITDQKDRERELREALVEAREAETLKARIVANLSHEIRTPLNHVIGLTSILQKEPELPLAERLTYLDMIKRGGLSTLRLATSVLDLSTIQSDHRPPVCRPFPFRESLTEIGARFAAQASEKGLRFASRLDPRLPDRLAGDPELLEKVLDNLLDNAVKFTAAGGVELHAELAAERGEELDVSFVVTDTGVGIAGEDLDKVFESFFRAPNSLPSGVFGAGLGLTIAKEISLRLGARLEAASEVGEGSSFRFLCPFRRAAA
jgi:PAS domain S-box-containing protein